MGCITVLIQHAWKMQNARCQPNGNPVSYEIDRAARMGRAEEAERETPLPKKPLISHIRINVPSSIAQLVSYYNACQINDEISECEVACFDALLRLEKLVLSSSVPDTQRQANVKIKLKKPKAPDGFISLKLNKKSEQAIEKIESEPKTSNENTIRMVSEARISLLIMARCRSVSLRDQSMLLLCEALDTNVLEVSEHEIMHLQMLWVELVQLLRQVLDSRRRKQSRGLDADFGTKLEKQNVFGLDSMIDDVLDNRILVDVHLEHLLMCIHLTLQRLDFCREMGQKIQSSTLMSKSYKYLLEDLPLMKTNDPFVLQIMSGINEHVLEVQEYSTLESNTGSVAMELGLSILAKIIKFSPPADIDTLDGKIISTLTDLAKANEFYMAKKLLRFIGSAAMLNFHVCQMFISLISNLDHLNWQLKFHGIIWLGTIACGSKFPTVRRLALEIGLIPLVSFDRQSENDWITRCAAVMALIEVYQSFRETPSGLLAREVISSRQGIEVHPFAQQIILSSRARKPQENSLRRISFLSEYTAIAIAENYLKIKNEYEYIQRDIMSVDRTIRKQANRHTTKAKPKDQKAISPAPETHSTRPKRPIRFKNLENLVFSTEPYHQNYKKEIFQHGIEDDLYSAYVAGLTTDDNNLLPSLKPSFVANTHAQVHVDSMHAKELGSVNRRKLFDAHPIVPVGDAVKEKVRNIEPVKMPPLPVINSS